MKKGTKCLVTGGAGFIGSHLVEALLGLGCKVIVIDNFFLGREENLSSVIDHPYLEIHRKDVCDKKIAPLFKGVYFVFHLAAIPPVQYSIDFPKKTNKVNIAGTLNILSCAKKTEVKKFIYSSSAAVYGDNQEMPLSEESNLLPLSPYALQKMASEHYCRLYYSLYGLKTISLRYFNVFGPRQNPKGGYANLVPRCFKLVLEKKRPEIYGDGTHTRDFIYVKDIIRANLAAVENDSEKILGHCFNIGCGEDFSVNKVVRLIIGQRNIKPLYRPPVVEPERVLADIAKAKKTLDWSPQYSFEEGLKETSAWVESEEGKKCWR